MQRLVQRKTDGLGWLFWVFVVSLNANPYGTHLFFAMFGSMYPSLVLAVYYKSLSFLGGMSICLELFLSFLKEKMSAYCSFWDIQ